MLAGRIPVVSALLVLLASQSVHGQQVELLVNGSFTSGLAGWEVRGDVYFEYGDAVLYGRPRLPASIAQTIDRPDLSLDLLFSYRISTVFHLHYGSPYVEARVLASVFNEAIMQEEAITLYSKKFQSAIPSPRNTYDFTVNLKEIYRDALPKPPRRVRVIFEAGFDDRSSMGGIQSIAYGHIHRASLLMVKPSPPPTITTTLTTTITTTEATTLTYTIRQSTPVMPIGTVSMLVLTVLLGAGATVGTVIYVYLKRKVTRR